jgi:hypothetical protein
MMVRVTGTQGMWVVGGAAVVGAIVMWKLQAYASNEPRRPSAGQRVA